MPEKHAERNIAVVLSAGRGSRMRAGMPKQYLELNGMPVIAWSLRVFEHYDGIDDVILVSAPGDIEYCRSEIVERHGFRKVRRIIPGGAERYLSVWEGLKEAGRILAEYAVRSAQRDQAGTSSYLFIHDGARPLVDEGILSRCLEDVRAYQACVAAMPVKDTIKVSDEQGFAARTPDRRLLWQIQTPQVFSFPLIYEAYRKMIDAGITDVTDDAMAVERETRVKVKLTEGSYRNIKVTTPEDLGVVEGLLLQDNE